MTQIDEGTVVLEACNWIPQYVTEIGCIEGALRYLGVNISRSWLTGGIGYAFFPFIPGECGQDHAYWAHVEYRGRLQHVGCRVTALMSDPEGRKRDVIEALHRGRPSIFFSWEAGEYVLVKGFGPDGMVLSFYGGNDAVRPWEELGDAYTVRAGVAAPPAQVVQEAAALALMFDDRVKSLTGMHSYYGNWRQLLNAGETFGHAMSFAAIQVSELRHSAAECLKEAAEQLDGKMADLTRSASLQYAGISAVWQELRAVIPFPDRSNEHRQAYTRDPATVKKIRPLVDAIVEREAAGIEQLRRIVASAR